MVFKVLCCVLLACTVTQATLWRPFGLIRSVGDAAFETLHENMDSAKKSVDAGLEGGKSLYDATVQAEESAADLGLSVPRFGLKLGGKLMGSDNSGVESDTEAVMSASSAQSEQPEKSVDTEEATKEELSKKSEQSVDTEEAAENASTQSGKSVNNELTSFFDNAKDAASETLVENNKSIEKGVHAGLDATNNIINAGVQKAQTGFILVTSPIRFARKSLQGFKSLLNERRPFV